MLKPELIESVVITVMQKNGHKLNGQERLMIRTHLSRVEATKERDFGEFKWTKPNSPR